MLVSKYTIILELLYNSLLGFEIIIDMDFLKCNGQWLRLIYIFAILTILAIHLRLLTIFLRWLQEMWSGPGIKKLLYLLIASWISALENGGYLASWLVEISSKSCVLIGLFWAELYDWYSTCHRLFDLLQGWPLNLMASMTGNFCFLTQFIRSYGLLLFKVILKNKTCFAALTDFLYVI